jgi:tetratricopeptide (TPR) repeat protein
MPPRSGVLVTMACAWILPSCVVQSQLQRSSVIHPLAALVTALVVVVNPCGFPLVLVSAAEEEALDGPTCVLKGKELFQQEQYEDAAMEFWKAVLLHTQTPPERQYNVQEVFQLFMQCYIVQGRMADGFAFVASESFQRGQTDMGQSYLQQALAVDSKNAAALAVQQEFLRTGEEEDAVVKDDDTFNTDLKGKTPEELYELASKEFAKKEFEECADIFEIGCLRSNNRLGPACANAVYCRSMITDYGFNGSQFDADMERISALTQKEATMYRLTDGVGKDPFAWRRATSVHPHMVRECGCMYMCGAILFRFGFRKQRVSHYLLTLWNHHHPADAGIPG